MKKTILILSLLALGGCAGVQQAIQGYGTIAVTGAHAAADTVVQAQKVAICDLPYSAILRNPDIIPAVRALCPSAGGMFLPDPAPAAQLVAQPAPKS